MGRGLWWWFWGRGEGGRWTKSGWEEGKRHLGGIVGRLRWGFPEVGRRQVCGEGSAVRGGWLFGRNKGSVGGWVGGWMDGWDLPHDTH